MNSYGAGPGFPKLMKSNYGDWVVNMRIRIRTANKDLWPYLNDKLSEEDKMDATAITSTQREDLSDLIYVMLSTEARNMLSKRIYEDGVELWNEIKAIFTVSGKRLSLMPPPFYGVKGLSTGRNEDRALESSPLTGCAPVHGLTP